MNFKTRVLEENWKNYAKGAALGGAGALLGDHFSDTIGDFNNDMQGAVQQNGATGWWNELMNKGQGGLEHLKPELNQPQAGAGPAIPPLEDAAPTTNADTSWYDRQPVAQPAPQDMLQNIPAPGMPPMDSTTTNPMPNPVSLDAGAPVAAPAVAQQPAPVTNQDTSWYDRQPIAQNQPAPTPAPAPQPAETGGPAKVPGDTDVSKLKEVAQAPEPAPVAPTAQQAMNTPVEAGVGQAAGTATGPTGIAGMPTASAGIQHQAQADAHNVGTPTPAQSSDNMYDAVNNRLTPEHMKTITDNQYGEINKPTPAPTNFGQRYAGNFNDTLNKF